MPERLTMPTPEPVYVLDASALLCLLFGEPGCDQVEERLGRALVSAVSYHEVLAKLIDRGVEAEEARLLLGELDIHIVAADREQADMGAKLRSHTHGKGLSLGDRSCLALAMAQAAVAVTADSAWASLEIGIEIEAIRQDEKQPGH
ncbi:type II toxin-antitoxin system VapC family toxin [Novosphingobium kaempferiae]|uniref:type II toxin-antitoxin system VapC family toxin n=1 Tax=Novosphingobium kaempferiae TaxID=2896849 RepID=UPI001E55D016|nr:type II toxin-antitoxin system VapC family toxin [Novosphingobium kaempferiae]